MKSKLLAASIVLAMLSPALGTYAEEPLVRGVSYVGLSVSDLDKAVAFYSGACDLKSVEQTTLSGIAAFDTLAGRDGVQAESQMLEGHNGQLRLMQFNAPSDAARATPPVPVEGPGFMHVCFQVLKELETYQRALAAGATTIGDPEMAQLNPRRTVYYAYVHDFDKRVVEIEHIDLGERAQTDPPKVDHKLRHICVSTPDIERLLAFYSSFLEKEPRRVGPISGDQFDMVSGHPGTNISMAWYPIGNFELEVNQYFSHPTTLPETPRPLDALGYNMVVFDVTDLDAATEKLVSAGGTIVAEPAPMDGGQIVFGRDPDGNLIGLLNVPGESLASTSRFHER